MSETPSSPSQRRARKFSWLILLVAFPTGVLLENKFPESSAGFWVILLGLCLFVIVFLGARDILDAIKQIARPVTKVVLGLLAAGVAVTLVAHFAPSLFPESAWAYALRYETDSNRIHIAPKPGDCDFLHAPIGLKGCHYEKSVQVMRYSKDVQTGQPIVSYDDGKTWNLLPEGEKPGSVQVYVDWLKVQD